jgi:DNA-binding MarR family transcriptional regulator
MTATKSRTETREEALEQLGSAFRGIMAALRRLRGRDTHRPGELSFAQFHLLFHLAGECELSTTKLATAADLAPGTTTQLLDGLEAKGLVERTRSEKDRRVVTCTLTDSGRELIAAKRAQWEGRWEETLSEFSGEELATAAAVLERLRAMYDQIEVA